MRHGRPCNLEGTTRRESRKSDRVNGTATDVIQGQSSLDWVMEAGKDGNGQAQRGRLNTSYREMCFVRYCLSLLLRQ